MNIGLGIGMPFNRSQIWLSLFDPSKLFTTGVNGVWYDPSDLTTLYRDSAGTLPVTAVEQPVGLILDKSKGLVLGPEIFTDVCVIQNNGTSGAYSAGAISNSLAGASTYPRYRWAQPSLQIGKTYKITIVQTNAAVFSNILFDNAIIAGAASLLNSSGTVTFYVKYNGVDNRIGLYAAGTVFSGSVSISVRELTSNYAFNPSGNSANFPVLSCRYNVLNNTETLATQSVTTRAAKYILSFWGTGSVALSGTYTGTLAGTGADNRVYVEFTATAGTLTLTVTGSVLKAQLEEL